MGIIIGLALWIGLLHFVGASEMQIIIILLAMILVGIIAFMGKNDSSYDE